MHKKHHPNPAPAVPKWSALLVEAVNKPGLKRARQKRLESDEPPKPRKPATVNRELCVLSKLFSLAVDAELLDDNPCRRVKKLRTANQRVRNLTTGEEEEACQALKGQDLSKDKSVMATT